MKFIKITNLFNKFGQPSYKGLDIDYFVAGSQNYDLKNGICITATREEKAPLHDDVIEITEEEYDVLYQTIEENKVAEPSEIDLLKAENEATKQALAELTLYISTLNN